MRRALAEVVDDTRRSDDRRNGPHREGRGRRGRHHCSAHITSHQRAAHAVRETSLALGRDRTRCPQIPEAPAVPGKNGIVVLVFVGDSIRLHPNEKSR